MTSPATGALDTVLSRECLLSRHRRWAVETSVAKHYIDSLEMLGEKTKGNLSDEESKVLSEALHALRMAYVGAKG